MEETKKTGAELESVSRRKAVKTIVGGVSALAAYNMLPVRWEKPIIEQIFLPVHAQTSGVLPEEPPAEEPPAEQPPATQPPINYPISSSPTSLSATNDINDEGDDIWITFDGAANLALILQSDETTTDPADGVIGFDTDPPPAPADTWDGSGPGANWSIVDDDGIGFGNASNNAPGTYTIVVSRISSGENFELTFTIDVSGDPPTSTVSGVSVQPSP